MESLESIQLIQNASLRIPNQISVQRLSGSLRSAGNPIPLWTEQKGQASSIRMGSSYYQAGGIPRLNQASCQSNKSSTIGLPVLNPRQYGAPSTSSKCVRAMHEANMQLERVPFCRYVGLSNQNSDEDL